MWTYTESVFCTNEVREGAPVSYYYDKEGINVRAYDDSNFYGVSCCHVLKIDPPEIFLFDKKRVGDNIEVVRKGIIVIQKSLFGNSHEVQIGKFFKPIVCGWKVQKKQTKKSVGIILNDDGDFLRVSI